MARQMTFNWVSRRFAGRSPVSPVARAARAVVEAMEPRRLLSGTLDTSFSGDGRTTTSFNANDRANAVAVQKDGKVLAAGSWDGGSSDFALARYNIDGTPDFNFGGGMQGVNSGKTNVAFGPGFGGKEFATGVAVQADGKIVLVGYTNQIDGVAAVGGNDIAIARFNSDGSLDASFSGDGRFTINTGGDDRAVGVVLQSDGKIVVGATNQIGNLANFAVLRLQTNGTVDPNFGNGGFNSISFGGEDVATGIALQSTGKIVVAGYTNVNDPDAIENQFAVVRFTSAGQADTGFDTDAKLTIDLPGASERANAVAVDEQDRIVLAGQAFENDADDFGIVRLHADGTLDNTFSSDGKATISLGVTDVARSVVVSSSGRITVVGSTTVNATLDYAAVRLDTFGVLDSTFDTDGRVTVDFGADDAAYAAALQADDKIILVGEIGPNANFGVVRLTGDGHLVVNGGAGNDTITFNGTNYVYNGATVPVDVPYTTSVVINGNGGNDTLTANKSLATARVTLFGGLGNDTMKVGGGDLDSNLLEDVSVAGGFGPDDLLTIDDSLDAGGDLYDMNAFNLGKSGAEGTALVSLISLTRVVVNLPNGNEQFNLNSSNAGWAISVNGNGGNDTITAGDDDFDTNIQGDTTVNGGTGTDKLIFADAIDDGNDTFTLSSTSFSKNTAIVSFAYTGIDGLTLNTGNASETINAQAASLPTLFSVGNGNNTVQAGSGNDTLVGGSGADSLFGNGGNDSIIGANGNDTLDGGPGNDLMFGQANDDQISGQAGNDSIEGGTGVDYITGGDGSDTLVGGSNNDVYHFDNTPAAETDLLNEISGGGSDTIDFSGVTTGVNVTLGFDTLATHANRTVKVQVAGTFDNFENGWGGTASDTLDGNGKNNVLNGFSGNDSISAGAGDDSLIGDVGNDLLDGGDGTDTAVGGSGNDLYRFSNAGNAQTDFLNEQSGGGLDTLAFNAVTTNVTAQLNGDTLATHGTRTVKVQYPGSAGNFENLTGGSANDSLTGNSKANVLTGGSGNDTLNGLTGNDTLYGNTGIDKLFGGDDNDTFYAADGATDTLDGGTGSDVLGSSDAGDVKFNIP